MTLRALAALAALVLVAACAAPQHERTTTGDVLRPADAPVYVAQGAPRLTVFTVINNRSGAGAHTALLVSGEERVLFDPAGSFRHEDMVEKGDVLYGMTPGWVQAFKSAHARASHHVVSQEIAVSPSQADAALRLVKSNGAVASAFCTNSTTKILRQIPGFEDVEVTFYPRNLMEQIAKRGDVVTDQYFEDDAGKVVDGIVPADTGNLPT